MKKEGELNTFGNNNLILCPFCGLDKDHAFGPRVCSNYGTYWIECSCGATQGHWASQTAAVKSWNKRV